MKPSFARTFRNFVVGTALAGCLVAAASASATLVRYDLNPTKVDAPAGSSTLAYTDQGYTITASGYNNANGQGTLTPLYFKNAGAGEIGLGVANTTDHELQVGSSTSNPFDFIQFDLTMLRNAGATDATFVVTSLQATETFTLFGSNVAGMLGTQIGGTYGGSDTSFTGSAQVPSLLYNYYSVAAGSGDVLPVSLSFQVPAPVPEMSALLPIIALLGLLGAVQVKRRRALRA
ncbi:MAG: hypothetical protein ABR526_09435 [Chthoniobacterales bacterium]